jgi:hypothetical protein
MAGLERYVRNQPPNREWLNPSTFLNQRRWEDEPPRRSTGSAYIDALAAALADDDTSREAKLGTDFDLELRANPDAPKPEDGR